MTQTARMMQDEEKNHHYVLYRPLVVYERLSWLFWGILLFCSFGLEVWGFAGELSQPEKKRRVIIYGN